MGMGLVGFRFTGDGARTTKKKMNIKKLKWIKPINGVAFNQRVRDQTTGFEGIVNAKCLYRTGCTHVEIQPTTLDKGKIRKSEWIDETLLEVLIEVPDEIKPRPKKRGPYNVGYRRSHGGPEEGPPEPSRPSMSRPEINGKEA